MYGTECLTQPDLIGDRCRAEEVKAWQARPLEPIYPIIYLDCIHVKVREGAVRVKGGLPWPSAIHDGRQGGAGPVACPDRGRQVLCRWSPNCATGACRTSSSPASMGSRGFPDAIEAVFPAVVQLCIVHMVRHSLNYVSWKRRRVAPTCVPHLHGRHRRGGRTDASR